MTERVQIEAPDFSGAVVSRVRLAQDLGDQPHRKLILVIAPPGYGKTTFLAEFAQTSDRPVCWAQLSIDEKDPEHLHELLTQSLIRRFRRLKGKIPAGGSEAPAANLGRALAEHVPERHALVLDDVQILRQSPEATAYLESLRRSLPDQTTLILAGRSLPDLSLAALVAADDVKSYGAVELTLEFEEMRELVELRTGGEVAEDAAQELYRETEGWITGVLLSPRLQPEFVTAGVGRSLVAEYFNEVAFAQEPAEIQQFLVDTAILPVFNAELSDHALGREDSQSLIEQLLKSGSYLFREGYYPEPLFRYQRQFGQFLGSKDGSPEDHAETITKRAAAWYQEHELPEYAFDLYMSVGDYEAAGKVADQWARPLYVRGFQSQIYDWAQRLTQVGAITPEVIRIHAVCEIYGQGNLGTTQEKLQKAYQLALKDGDPSVRFRILSSQFLIYIEFGANENPKQLLDEMREILPLCPADYAGNFYTNLLSY
ncbi:MAG: AAA family ATPase, partial [Anaerolineales bacterium]